MARYFALIISAVGALAACSTPSDLSLRGANVTQQGCDGSFTAAADIFNPTRSTVRGRVSILQRGNVADLNVVPNTDVEFPAGQAIPIRFDGRLPNKCDDGLIRFVIAGTDNSDSLDVDITAVIDGAPQGGPVGGDPTFNYTVTYTCCGVGFADDYELVPINQNNTRNLNASPNMFTCAFTEPHPVTVSGRLRTMDEGLVRLRIRDSARDVSCTLDEKILPEE